MKSTWNTLWNNFKAQPDIWFFYGFLLTFTLTIRKVLFFYPLGGSFNEYTGAYLYLSDLFLSATFLFFILRNKSSFLSIFRNVPPQKEANCSTWNNWLLRGKRGTTYVILALITWSLISIIWSQIWTLTLFRFVKLLEVFGLFLYIAYRIVPHGTLLKRVLQLIIFLGFIQAIIGIFQVILQDSIGLFWLKESLISPDIPGVAKIILNGHKLIRAYGLFPHPNILGGFLLLSVTITFAYKRLFHPSHKDIVPPQKESQRSTLALLWRFVPRGTNLLQSGWNIGFLRGERGTSILLNFALAIQILAQMLTLSKSAILGLILAFSYLYYHIYVPPQKESNCSMWNNWILRGRRGTFVSNIKKVILIILILVTAIFIVKPDLNSIVFQSLKERLVYLNVSRGTILSHPLAGIGIGQFVPAMATYATSTLETWQYQPVHNVFLLIWSELGIIGLGLFLWLLWLLFCPSRIYNVPRGTLNLRIVFRSILIGFIFIMFFDHYFWDIQQGQMMLWMVMGFIVGESIT